LSFPAIFSLVIAGKLHLNLQQQDQSSELELVNACDLCGGKVFEKELVVDGWNLNRCSGCGLVFTSPRYTEMYLQRMYRERYYDLATDYLKGQLLEPSEDIIHNAQRLLKMCASSDNAKFPRSLDVGCGGGIIVDAFQKAGWHAVGIDLNTKAINLGKNRGLDLRGVSIGDQALGQFNLISALHILEHTHSPKLFLHQCAERLVQHGYLLIEVPNYGCRSAKRMGQSWPYLYPDGHLYQFAVDTIMKYLNQAGFEGTEIRRVQGRGPLEDYSTCPTYRTKQTSEMRRFLFSMRHLVYWSPFCRRLIRYVLWNTLGYGEFVRILARKRS
jgi:SAM-dependent methyltransferase